ASHLFGPRGAPGSTAPACAREVFPTLDPPRRPRARTPAEGSWFSFGGSLARRFDEYVHLLSHEERYIPVRETKDRLQNPRVNSFRTVAGQRLLGDDQRLEPDEFERGTPAAVSALGGTTLRARTNAPSIVFIDVRTHMQPGNL